MKDQQPGDLIDLSHTIEDGLLTYKGLPAPIICDFLSREQSREKYEDATFQFGKIEMVGNTGTYIDCPFHRYENGKDFSELLLPSFVDLDAVVIRVPFENAIEIGKTHIENIHIDHKAVLFHTGWDRFWTTDRYFENHPYLTEEAAIFLRDHHVKLAGIDSVNIDNSTHCKKRPVHTILLGADILIVEHLCNLSALPDDGFTVSAVPPKIKGTGTFPVRAYGKINK
jgi:arylformamidase